MYAIRSYYEGLAQIGFGDGRRRLEGGLHCGLGEIGAGAGDHIAPTHARVSALVLYSGRQSWLQILLQRLDNSLHRSLFQVIPIAVLIVVA